MDTKCITLAATVTASDENINNLVDLQGCTVRMNCFTWVFNLSGGREVWVPAKAVDGLIEDAWVDWLCVDTMEWSTWWTYSMHVVTHYLSLCILAPLWIGFRVCNLRWSASPQTAHTCVSSLICRLSPIAYLCTARQTWQSLLLSALTLHLARQGAFLHQMKAHFFADTISLHLKECIMTSIWVHPRVMLIIIWEKAK